MLKTCLRHVSYIQLNESQTVERLKQYPSVYSIIIRIKATDHNRPTYIILLLLLLL